MDTKELKEKLNEISQKFQAKGKDASIDLYLCLLETAQEYLKDKDLGLKTVFIGYSGPLVEVSTQSSPHGISNWSEQNKTEMNIVIGPWEFDVEHKRFISSDQICFFLESWHGYLLGEINPFLISEDQLRYSYRKVAKVS